MDFKIVPGITSKQVTQLLKYSKTDSQVKKYTSDSSRFKNIESFKRWKKKGRVIYTLVDGSRNLLGIIWFGKEKIPAKKFILTIIKKEFRITFAIRIYSKIRSKGKAISFMNKAYELFTKSQEFKLIKNKRIWLEVSIDNLPALKLYDKFGFVKVTYPDKKGKVFMALTDSKSVP